MRAKSAHRLMSLLTCLSVLLLLTACSSQQLSTEAQEKAAPQTAPAEPPKAAEPPKIEEAKAEPSPPAPTPPQEKPAEPPPPPAPVLTLTDVYFDYDRYAIRDEAKGELATVARQLKEDNSRKLLIEGHCDDRGTVVYNLVLGERRAQAVKRYLEGLGVSSSQIETISYGKDKPVCTDPSEDCRQKNRRAHFVLA